jgi:hypothetical protein
LVRCVSLVSSVFFVCCFVRFLPYVDWSVVCLHVGLPLVQETNSWSIGCFLAGAFHLSKCIPWFPTYTREIDETRDEIEDDVDQDEKSKMMKDISMPIARCLWLTGTMKDLEESPQPRSHHQRTKSGTSLLWRCG